MITPISATTSYSKSLEPVKVPHFTGAARVAARVGKNKDTVTFKQQAQTALKTAQRSAGKTCKVIGRSCKRGYNFTKDFVKSLYEDATGIAKKRLKNKVTKADGIAEILA